MSMTRAIPIRDLPRQTRSNSRRMCRYAPPSRAGLPSHVPSADTKSPRICTFSSYLNFNPFNTYASGAAISCIFCRCEIRGEGPCPPKPACPADGPWRSGGDTQVQKESCGISCHSTARQGTRGLPHHGVSNRMFFLFSALHTPASSPKFQLPYFQAIVHSRGRGVPSPRSFVPRPARFRLQGRHPRFSASLPFRLSSACARLRPLDDASRSLRAASRGI